MRTHKVGTITLGLALVVFGILFLLHLLVRAAPLSLPLLILFCALPAQPIS